MRMFIFLLTQIVIEMSLASKSIVNLMSRLLGVCEAIHILIRAHKPSLFREGEDETPVICKSWSSHVMLPDQLNMNNLQQRQT